MNTMYNLQNGNINNMPNINPLNSNQDSLIKNNQNSNIPNGYLNYFTNLIPNQNLNNLQLTNNNPALNNLSNFQPGYSSNINQGNNQFLDNANNNYNFLPTNDLINNSFNVATDNMNHNLPITNNIPLNNYQNINPNMNNIYGSNGLLNKNSNIISENNTSQSGLFDNIGSEEKKKKPNDEYKKSLLDQIESRRCIINLKNIFKKKLFIFFLI